MTQHEPKCPKTKKKNVGKQKKKQFGKKNEWIGKRTTRKEKVKKKNLGYWRREGGGLMEQIG